eukprot:TRINITY_DN4803_c0_g1_i2.p1 TRINITY_DN4803_c0_g1~~TRINITY_DN4803_c0_g1_i2.p1  ORF type:complete len:309 (-),score=79.41 TRINITY_DN4803_c0_g1_i2:4-930(-)
MDSFVDSLEERSTGTSPANFNIIPTSGINAEYGTSFEQRQITRQTRETTETMADGIPIKVKPGFLSTFFSVLTYIVAVMILLTAVPISFYAFIFTYFFDKGRYVCGKIFRFCGVFIVLLNPFWKVTVTGNKDIKPKKTVFVSNHLSIVDCVLIGHVPWEMKWLYKAEAAKIPLVGMMLKLAGDVPVDRSSRESTKESMATCTEWLQLGANVMIFPEGRRMIGETMGDFKDGAFRLAIENQCDLMPMAIIGSNECMAVHDWRFSSHADCRIKVGQPISTKGMTLNDVESLKENAKNQIQTLYDQLKKSK